MCYGQKCDLVPVFKKKSPPQGSVRVMTPHHGEIWARAGYCQFSNFRCNSPLQPGECLVGREIVGVWEVSGGEYVREWKCLGKCPSYTRKSPPPVFGVASIQGGMSPQFDYSVTLRRISVLINVLCKLPHFIFLANRLSI